MKTYYAIRNQHKNHKKAPDYFVFLPRIFKSEKGEVAGRIYMKKSKAGDRYLKIIIFQESEEIEENGHEPSDQ